VQNSKKKQILKIYATRFLCFGVSQIRIYIPGNCKVTVSPMTKKSHLRVGMAFWGIGSGVLEKKNYEVTHVLSFKKLAVRPDNDADVGQ